jgi:predicted phage gp36 major capsid-like protein
MAEIIDLAEIAAERRRHRSARAPQRQSLERAVAVLEQSLADTARILPEAPRARHREILERIERLTTMIRYAMRMLGQGSDPGLDPNPDRAGR